METANKKNRATEFNAYWEQMYKNSRMHEDIEITPDNVFQEAHRDNRDLFFETIKKCHLPGSCILGVDHIVQLGELAKQGKSCLVFSEHVSNLDVPNLYTRFYDTGDNNLKDLFERFVFISGTKLNETPWIKLFTEMFSRVVVYAFRSLVDLKNKETDNNELELAGKINLRATRKIGELKTQGYILYLFASGTRYRPWAPETKRGIPIIYSYLKMFDYFCCVSANGNTMPPVETEDMILEPIYDDQVVFNYGPVTDAREFLQSIEDACEHDIDSECNADKNCLKQFVADKVMEEIEVLHNEAELYRQKFV